MLVTKLRSQARKLFLYFIFLLLVFERASSAVNITVAVIMERSPTDMPFGINRTIGVINNAIDKSKKIVNQSINLNFIIRYTDVPTCTYFQFGALAAEIYYTSGSEINAIIGPGKENIIHLKLYAPPLPVPHNQSVCAETFLPNLLTYFVTICNIY